MNLKLTMGVLLNMPQEVYTVCIVFVYHKIYILLYMFVFNQSTQQASIFAMLFFKLYFFTQTPSSIKLRTHQNQPKLEASLKRRCWKLNDLKTRKRWPMVAIRFRNGRIDETNIWQDQLVISTIVSFDWPVSLFPFQAVDDFWPSYGWWLIITICSHHGY